MAKSVHPPIIGISMVSAHIAWGPWSGVPADFVPRTYSSLVEQAGGVPIEIPASKAAHAVELVLDRIDGLLIPGGDDIDPSRYRAARDPRTGPPVELRDEVEITLLAAAIERSVPVLSICRGCQLLNVVRGGTLVQDLTETGASPAHRPKPGTFGEHPIRLDGAFGKLFGEDGVVRSHHHQTLGEIGNGLRGFAWAPDGGVEGIQLLGQAFCLGVLWHPEEQPDEISRKLFEALVHHSSVYARGAVRQRGRAMEPA